MAFSNGPTIVTSGLVLSLDAGDRNSYPGSGTTWIDLSGNSNNGTLTNGPTFSSANGGNIVFDGSDDYVNEGTFPAIDFSNGCTIEVVVKFDTLAGNWVRFIDFGNGLGPGIIVFGKYSSTNNIFFESRDNTGSDVQRIYYSTGTPLIVNELAFYTTTVPSGTPGTPTSGCLLYKNGLSIAGANQDANYPRIPPTITRSNSYIARSNFPSDSYLDGNIYSLKIYNKTLTAQEVLQNYNATKTRFGL